MHPVKPYQFKIVHRPLSQVRRWVVSVLMSDGSWHDATWAVSRPRVEARIAQWVAAVENPQPAEYLTWPLPTPAVPLPESRGTSHGELLRMHNPEGT
jgi:hypothetical protein